MKNIEILALNRTLSEIKISGDGITREMRSKLMINKIELTKLAEKINEDMQAIRKENIASDLLNQTIEDYLIEDKEVTIKKLSDEEIDIFVDKTNTLNAAQLEQIYLWLKL